MAAERLNLPQDEAIQYLADRLHQAISEEAVLAYKKSLSVADRYQEMWQIAHENMRKLPADYRQVINSLGWNFPAHIDTARIMEGPARLFGIAGPKITSKYLKHLFPVKTGAVAILPFYKTPTQLGSFVCFSGNNATFIGQPGSGRGGYHIGENGFAGLQFLWQMNSQAVVVTSMLQQMVKLHMHNFSSSTTPLPVLGWQPNLYDSNQRPWSVLNGRKTIIWEQKPTAAVVHQAMISDAYLTFVGPDVIQQDKIQPTMAHWHRWIHHDPASVIWHRIAKTAKPYLHALKNWARFAKISEKTRLLQDAEEYSVAVARLVRSIVAPSLRTEVGRRITVPTSGSGIITGSNGHTVIIERNNKWYTLKDQVKWPAITRVTHIVVRTNAERELIGYLQNEKTKVPFRVYESKATSAWLRQFGTNHGMYMQCESRTNIFDNKKTDNFNPFDAAMRFEEPEIVVGLDRIGWDGSGFQFSNSRLLNGAFHQIPDFTLPPKSPGPHQSYCQLRDEVKHALQRNCVEMEIGWALAIALCAQVTAPAIGLHPQGICLQRNEHDPISKALFFRFEIEMGPYEDWQHNWPRRLENLTRAIRFDDTGMFVVRVNQEEFKKHNQITVLNANDPDLEPRNISYSFDKTILHYLREFSKQTHTPVYDWKIWLEYTTRNMQELFADLNSTSLKNCSQRLQLY